MLYLPPVYAAPIPAELPTLTSKAHGRTAPKSMRGVSLVKPMLAEMVVSLRMIHFWELCILSTEKHLIQLENGRNAPLEGTLGLLRSTTQ
jgi:hypothetical protein